MTKLEAVNAILRAIGSSPVQDLETPNVDTVMILETLEEKRRELLLPGWWFNTVYNTYLTPDPITNQIYLADTLLSVQPADTNLVLRGRHLYDLSANSYEFTSPVLTNRVVQNVEWDDMPIAAQTCCRYMAEERSIVLILEDMQRARRAQDNIIGSLDVLKREQLKSAPVNIFRNAYMANYRANTLPYGRR